MAIVEKISEITNEQIAEYIRLEEPTENELIELQTYLEVAKSYIKGYTGIKEFEDDLHTSIAIVIYVLCQDMYDNKTLYLDRNANINKLVQSTLDMHCVNLL